MNFEHRVGKFSNNIAELVYDMSLDREGEEIGCAEDIGWHYKALLDSPLIVYYPSGCREKIWAAILSEDENGHIDVETFESTDSAEARWRVIEREYYDFYDEDYIEEDE